MKKIPFKIKPHKPLKRSPLRKKAKTKTESWYRKECVKLAKVEAKERDNWTCQKCGRSKAEGYQIHGSHIMSEGKHRSMSADPDNIIAKCAQCHMWWHENPAESWSWFLSKYPELAKVLLERARVPFQVNWRTKYEELCK